MNKPLISVCIPTYTRVDCLRDGLNSIVSQFNDKEVRDQVEVIITDDASTDSTEEMVKEFLKKYDNIKYFRNVKNIREDRNKVLMVEKANGEYCLSLGDDDALFPGSLSYLIERIKTTKAPYLLMNCWGYDRQLLHPALPHPNRQDTTDKVYKTLSDFVKSIKNSNYNDLIGNFSGLSLQLFKRKAWLDFPGKERYFDTSVLHFFILLTVFKDSPFVLLGKPTVITRADNIRWDLAPGFNTLKNRIKSNIRLTLWINDMYNLSLSSMRIKIHYYKDAYVASFKMFVKNIFYKIGLRKYPAANIAISLKKDTK